MTYPVAELIKGARDAEDAVKRFKEDPGRFVRPVVCSLLLFFFSSFFLFILSVFCEYITD